MTLDEALGEAVCGMEVTADHMQAGCFVDYPRGGPFYRNWPNGDRCEFRPDDVDNAAEWVEFVKPLPVKPDAWGRPNVPEYLAAVDALIGDPKPKRVFVANPGGGWVKDKFDQLPERKGKGEPGGIIGHHEPGYVRKPGGWGAPSIDTTALPWPDKPEPKRDSWGRPI